MSPIAFVALFGAGVASFLAPCVVPLLPAYVAALCAGGRRAVPAVAAFVTGFVVVFVALGAAASRVGAVIDTTTPAGRFVCGLVVAVLGVSLLAPQFVPVGRLPRGPARRCLERQPTARPARPFLLGVVFASAWSPCVGPLLGAALAVAANSATAATGGLLLLAYALGLAAPFVILAATASTVPAVTTRLRRSTLRLERASGFLLVAVGLAIATGLYDSLTSLAARQFSFAL